jgi:hypothetical protein
MALGAKGHCDSQKQSQNWPFGDLSDEITGMALICEYTLRPVDICSLYCELKRINDTKHPAVDRMGSQPKSNLDEKTYLRCFLSISSWQTKHLRQPGNALRLGAGIVSPHSSQVISSSS